MRLRQPVIGMGGKGGAERTFGVGIGRADIQCVFALGGVGVDVKCRSQSPATALPTDLPELERQALRALILDELRRLHEGVLARYGLRPSQLKAWKDAQGL